MPFRTDRMLEIETRLDELTKQNAALLRRLELSMRHDHICPRCEHGEVAHAESILDRSEAGRLKLALIQPSAWSGRTEGEFEAFVCRACGFVELYVKEPGEVGSHAKSKDSIAILRSDLTDSEST